MDLEPGETIIFEGHPSWRSILGYYIKGLLAAVVIAAIVAGVTKAADDQVKKGLVAAAFVAVLAIVLVVGYVKRLFTTYTISSRRLHIRRGIISRKEQQTQISRVQNVNTNQGVLERILQIGTVDFDTAAGGDFDFKFAGVSDPTDVVEAVHRAQQQSDAVTAGPNG